MFRVFGVLFLALGLIVLGVAVVAVIRGRIWRDPLKLKSHPRRRPGRWLHRAADPGEFWLDVAWHALIAAAVTVSDAATPTATTRYTRSQSQR